MREKTDEKKLQEGRGTLTETGYEAWKTARESTSRGTACAVYDPIQQRTVNLLSQGEKVAFWALRYMVAGRILEQYPMDRVIVKAVCRELGIKTYRILSTDFVAEKDDGSCIAISVKPNSSVFTEKDSNYVKNINRQNLEARYWERFGIPHYVVFSDDIDFNFAMNVKDCMRYWDSKWVKKPEEMLMYLIAHHAIQIPLGKERLQFRHIAELISVEQYYETYQRCKHNSNFQGWRIDLS